MLGTSILADTASCLNRAATGLTIPAVAVAYGVDRRRKVAIVLAPSTIHEDEARIYADLVHRNALPHRVFSDPEAALHWLVGSESSDA